MMSLWDALRMNMMISYQELVRTFLSFQAATSFTQYAGNYDVGSGHAIGNHDGVVDYSAGFSRFPYPGPAVGDGVNHVTVRPRNIAFNFLVRAK